MEMQPQAVEIGDWTVRVQAPPGEGPHPVIVMLHGWLGDETVMWVFAARLPKDALLIAPRGLFAAPQGGFSWYAEHAGGWADLSQFQPAVERLTSELLTAQNFPQADLSRLSVVGFSQGAALAYSLALLEPARVRSLAGLAGFMPAGAEAALTGRPLEGKRAFVAHGSQDEIVPVRKARQAVELLERAGADVTYCEDEVGHKLSASCFRGLEGFFRA